MAERSMAGPADRRAERERVESICRTTLDFWAHHGAADEGRGYLACLQGDGRPYDARAQHLVASARFVVNFATGARTFADQALRAHADTALEFLRRAHHDDAYGGYYWRLEDGRPSDARKVLYGHAFVLLAAACALLAGLPAGGELLGDVAGVLERRFSGDGPLAEPNYWSPDWTTASRTRGQNPNMHLCEALIAAYDATAETRYLEHALAIADELTRRLADGTPGGVVWETFDTAWRPLRWPGTGDEDRSAMDSPFNVIPGHQAEWAKLLGLLHRRRRLPWLLGRARQLYSLAWHGWDDDGQGFYMVLDDDLGVLSDRRALEQVRADWSTLKSYWSPSEAIGAAAVLEQLTGEACYAADRARLWRYCREYMIDEERGGWFKVPATGTKDDSAPKGDLYDPDYHALGACFETLRSLQLIEEAAGSAVGDAGLGPGATSAGTATGSASHGPGPAAPPSEDR
jgi:mannose/cellobiose epimerase-like protein (N-acyl-D-glucosamine 2-epimerase family)